MATFTVQRTGKKAVRIALIATALSGALFAGANEWTNLGPEGGSVLHLAADPQNPVTVYAATCAGMFKSADGGASWIAVNSGLPVGCFGMVAIDPQNAGTVYAVSSQGVFKTTDRGTRWRAIHSGQSGTTCFAAAGLAGCPQPFAMDPTNPRTLYAGGKGIFKSTDGGMTWTQVSSGFLSGEDDILVLAVDPQNAGTVYACGSASGLFKSTDGGANWGPANSGISRVSVLAVDPQNPGTLYTASGSQIFKSTDGGMSWNPASFGLPPAPAPSAGLNAVVSLSVNPQHPALINALISQSLEGTFPSSFLVMSADGGASWTTATDPTVAASYLNTITADPQDPGTLYVGTSNGVLKTNDGGAHWNFANSGLRATSIGQVLIDPQGETLLAVTASGFFAGLSKSTDGGISWAPSGSGLPSALLGSLVPQDPHKLGTLLTMGEPVPYRPNGKGLFESQDAGESWAQIWTAPNTDGGIGPLAISAQAPNIMYSGVSVSPQCCESKVAKSVDAGRTWTQPQVAFTTAGEVGAIAVDPQNPNIVYAGTESGGWGASGLWKSMDGGASWQNFTGTGTDEVYALLIDPRSSGTIYYSDGSSLHNSTDGGMTWTATMLPDTCFDTLVMDPQDSSTLYCGGVNDAKVFRSADAGVSWTEVGSGLRGNVNSLTFEPQDPRTLYAGTDGGLFAITFEALSGRRPIHR